MGPDQKTAVVKPSQSGRHSERTAAARTLSEHVWNPPADLLCAVIERNQATLAFSRRLEPSLAQGQPDRNPQLRLSVETSSHAFALRMLPNEFYKSLDRTREAFHTGRVLGAQTTLTTHKRDKFEN